MVFETKKVNLETLGEYLSEVRSQLGLSVAEVSEKIGMKQQYITALEEGDFVRLPPDVYVFGFLKKLAELYHADARQLTEQYKKERGIHQQLQKRREQGAAAGRFFQGAVITPRVVAVAAGLLFVGVTIVYIIWQIASINKTPSLEIVQPQDRQIIKQTAVTVEGKTDPGMTVSINGQSVFVDEKGRFQAQLGIGQGPKDLVFTVQNKFDKSITRTVSVIGESQPGTVAGAEAAAALVLKLSFTGHAEVSYKADNAEPVEQVFENGSSTIVSAQEKVLLSTSNAGATRLELNGKDVGPLGRAGERLKDIPFSPDTQGENKSRK